MASGEITRQMMASLVRYDRTGLGDLAVDARRAEQSACVVARADRGPLRHLAHHVRAEHDGVVRIDSAASGTLRRLKKFKPQLNLLFTAVDDRWPSCIALFG